jgi:hypothetical protein
MSASAAEVGRQVTCRNGWRVTTHVEVRKGPLQGQIVSARDLPTRCQQQCSLVVPTVRALRYLTEPSAKSLQKQPTKRPERESSAGRRVRCLAYGRSRQRRGRCLADTDLMTISPLSEAPIGVVAKSERNLDQSADVGPVEIVG